MKIASSGLFLKGGGFNFIWPNLFLKRRSNLRTQAWSDHTNSELTWQIAEVHFVRSQICGQSLRHCKCEGKWRGAQGGCALPEHCMHAAEWLRGRRMAREQLAWRGVGTQAQIIASFKCLESCLWAETDQAVLPPEWGLMVDSSSPSQALSSQLFCSDMASDWGFVSLSSSIVCVYGRWSGCLLAA